MYIYIYMCTFTYPYKTDYTIVTSFCPRWALVAARMLQRPSTGYVKSISDIFQTTNLAANDGARPA